MHDATSDSAVRHEARRAVFLIALTLAYMAVVQTTASVLGLGHLVSIFSYSGLAGLTWMVGGVMIFIAYNVSLLANRIDRPFARMWHDVRGQILAPRPLVMRAAPLLMVPMMLGTFTSFKGMLPHLQPFTFDGALHDFDSMLFFGIEPWRVTHAVLGGMWPTYLLSFAYNMWFFIMWLAVMYMTVRIDRPVLRCRFLLAFVLSWIVIGSLGAVMLSSAGPCFVERLGGPPHYAELMARLRHIDADLQAIHPMLRIYALVAQDLLWAAYSKNFAMLGSGISAMPSMHVAIATLLALGAFPLSRRLGWIMAAYMVVIWIGSVHLGWHYFADGLVSAPLTWLIWTASGAIVRRLTPEANDTTIEAPALA